MTRLCWRPGAWIFLFTWLALPLGVHAVDTGGAGATNEQGVSTAKEADLVAGQSQLADLGKATEDAKNSVDDRLVTHAPGIDRWQLALVGILGVGGIVGIRKLVVGLFDSSNTWMTANAYSSAAEEKSFSDFIAQFRAGPKTESRPKPRRARARPVTLEPEPPPPWLQPPAARQPATSDVSEPVIPRPHDLARNGDRVSSQEEAPVSVERAQFYATISENFARMRKLISQSCGEADGATAQKNLKELAGEIGGLKEQASLPELRPVWQLSASLEGLLNQVDDKPAHITLSVLNTVTGAVNLLQALSTPGIRPEIVTEPEARILALDDDAICRHAVLFALKKALNAPQLESNPEAALAFAEKRPYDVILLDVEMPGMDGLELCSRIRKTELNRDTPVLFVTRHSDYETRSKSALVGGQDLIAKPFMIFEITVKTLTLLIRGRLKSAPCSAVRA